VADRSTPQVSQQITWVYARDLEGTCRFYGEVLGLDMTLDEGKARIYRASDSAYIGICEAFGGRVVEPKGGMITLVTDDVDAWFARLEHAGATLKGAPERHEAFNIYAFLAEDPNGYLIEFQQFLDPNWPKGK